MAILHLFRLSRLSSLKERERKGECKVHSVVVVQSKHCCHLRLDPAKKTPKVRVKVGTGEWMRTGRKKTGSLERSPSQQIAHPSLKYFSNSDLFEYFNYNSVAFFMQSVAFCVLLLV